MKEKLTIPAGGTVPPPPQCLVVTWLLAEQLMLMVNHFCAAVAPVVKVPNQLLGAPLGTDVQLECYVEAFPNTINYWVKNRGEMLLDG
jgi:hypothetical protein